MNHSIEYQVKAAMVVDTAFLERKEETSVRGYFTKCRCGWWSFTRLARKGRQIHAQHIIGTFN